MPVHRIAITAIAGLVVVAPAGLAEDLSGAAERTVACLDIAETEARLACFEAGATALAASLDQTQAAETAPAAPEEPEWAAAPEPTPEPKADDNRTPIWARVLPREDPDAVDQIDVSVTRILRNKAGRHFFMTADGQEWEQTVVEIVRPPERLPAAATIRESLMGSPTLVFEDGPSGAYKVRRVK